MSKTKLYLSFCYFALFFCIYLLVSFVIINNIKAESVLRVEIYCKICDLRICVPITTTVKDAEKLLREDGWRGKNLDICPECASLKKPKNQRTKKRTG